MSDSLKEVRVEMARKAPESRQTDVYVFDGARRIGRYQVRTNADGRRDVYYADIEDNSFNRTRKVRKPADPDPDFNPAVAAIVADLAARGLSAPALLKPEFRTL